MSVVSSWRWMDIKREGYFSVFLIGSDITIFLLPLTSAVSTFNAQRTTKKVLRKERESRRSQEPQHRPDDNGEHSIDPKLSLVPVNNASPKPNSQSQNRPSFHHLSRIVSTCHNRSRYNLLRRMETSIQRRSHRIANSISNIASISHPATKQHSPHAISSNIHSPRCFSEQDGI